MRPMYKGGQRYGDAGINSGCPLFHSHEHAMRFQLGELPLKLVTRHYAISVAEVLDLRVSLRSRIPDLSAPVTAFSYVIRYNAESDTYELCMGDTCLCHHRDIRVVAALLRGERFEPGYIAKVLSAEYAPDHVTLDADSREHARLKAAEAAAQTKAARAAADDAARERRRLIPETEASDDLSIDDLLNDL